MTRDTSLNVPLLQSTAEVRTTSSVQNGPGDTVPVSTLLQGKFSNLVNYLESNGVKKLGSISVNAYAAAELMSGGDNMACLGTDMEGADWQALWGPRLQRALVQAGRTEGWLDDVVLDCYLLTVEHASSPDDHGLLRHLMRLHNLGRCTQEVFSLPVVQALIHFKWNRYVRGVLLLQLSVFLVWLLSFTVFTALLQDEDGQTPLSQLLGTTAGRASVLCQVLSLLAMIPFAYIKVSSLLAYGLSAWASHWNVLDVVSYSLQVVISVIHLTDSLRPLIVSTPFLALVAAQVVVLYFKLQYFTRVFQPARPSFVDTATGVFANLADFMGVYIMLIWAFAVAFYVLFANDRDKDQFADWRSLWTAMVASYSALDGGMQYSDMLTSSAPALMSAVFMIFQFSMVLCLGNLIFGYIIGGVGDAVSNQGLKALLAKAGLVDETDAALPSVLEERLGRQQGWFPRFIYVLKVDSSSVDTVKLDADWPVEGVEDYYQPPAEAEAGSGEVAELKSYVAELEGEVAELRALITGLCEGSEAQDKGQSSKGAAASS
mmetsp:Transcript_31106/g.69099  ORF Transcript_31106/g.69099 Transcript_31106/m.69099 type:complete len:545 (+) Transcript_31106:22-1656(+)